MTNHLTAGTSRFTVVLNTTAQCEKGAFRLPSTTVVQDKPLIYIYMCVCVCVVQYWSQHLNKSWRQHPIKQQLYGYLPPVTKTIKIRRTGHVGHCWRSRYELLSDILLWTPSQRRAKAGRPAQTYIQQLWADTGCSPEDLPKAMDDREEWWERVKNIRADSTTWWWWYIYIYTCVCVCMCVCVLGATEIPATFWTVTRVGGSSGKSMKTVDLTCMNIP